MSTREDEAFAALVRRHQPALYRYVRRRVPAADADDVVAEVFAAAWRHRDRLPDRVELCSTGRRGTPCCTSSAARGAATV